MTDHAQPPKPSAPKTLIEDPYGWATPAEASSMEFLAQPSQAESAALDRLEAAMQAAPAPDPTTTPEAVSAEAAARLLAAQIAEDQSLTEELSAKFASDADAAAAEAVEPPLVNRHAEGADAGLWIAEELEAALSTLFFLSDRPLSRERLLKALRGGEKAAKPVAAEAVPASDVPAEVSGESLQADGPEPEAVEAEPVESEPMDDAKDSLQLDAALEALRARYEHPSHGFELREIDGGYQLRTKPRWAGIARRLVRVQTQRLSSGAMETLAIIAYRQPVLKDELDKIRGVDSSYFLRGLLDRKLIEMTGRSELPGRPILYGTTPQFLELFGLADTGALPPLHELERMVPQSQAGASGEGAERELDPRVREMRKMVAQMKSDSSEALLKYDPDEDERFLTEIRERVKSIPSSTPSLDAQRQAEKDAAAAAAAPPTEPPAELPV